MKTIILNHKCYLSIEEIEKYKKEIEKIKTKENLVLLFTTILINTHFHAFKSICNNKIND